MSIRLPTPIATYVDAENSGDLASLAACFAANAVVRDEGRTHRGLAAIREWKAETKRKYNHTVTPLEISEHGGRTVLKAMLAGDFAGSPVTLQFHFVLKGGKISALDIGI